MLLEASFELRAGDFELTAELALDDGVLMLFGPSGSGKSLTISALAGLMTPTRGHIRLGGEALFDSAAGVDVPARRRQIGYVPQHHSLFPFADVATNVAFGLPKERRRRDDPKVAALLDELDLLRLADARPASLSGGERQRVALARALAVEPKLLLLDEPFASIDRDGRKRLRRILRETLDRHGTPAVFVTHSPGEALELGTRMVQYERGRTVRSGTPAEVLGGSAIVIEGVASGDPIDAGDGSAEVRLTSATLRGPAGQVAPDEEGRVRVSLPAGEEP